MKKILSFVMLLGISLVFIACNETITTQLSTALTTEEATTDSPTTTGEDITIDVDAYALTLIEGESYQMVVTSNDAEGLIYSVDVADIITLSDTGYITALSEGNATVTITSRTDSNVFIEVSVEVRKEVYLISNLLDIDMVEGDTHQLVISSNDDYTFDVTNSDILAVDEDGLILAKSEGTTTIIVTSTYDPSVSVTITVEVDKLITLDVGQSNYVMVVGDNDTLDVASNDGLTYISGNSNVVTVNDQGQLSAVGFGQTSIIIRSTYDESVEAEVQVTVYKYTETISIIGNDFMIKDMQVTLSIESTPVGSFDQVIWSSSDESILTVDEFGQVTALGSGSASIIATSTLDDSIVDVFDITVVNVLVVDESKTSEDTYLYESLELIYGEQLFSTISDALLAADQDTLIYIDAGLYQEDLVIDTEGIHLIGLSDQAIIDGQIDVQANRVKISELVFQSHAQIINSVMIDHFVFENNIVRNITLDSGAFIHLLDSANTHILYNTFDQINVDAIAIMDVQGALTNIEGNIISHSQVAITIGAEQALENTDEIKIFWNEISDVAIAFQIDLLVDAIEQDLYKVARFNKITNFVQGAVVNEGSTFDLTLNYWNGQAPNLEDFTNVDAYYLKGFYLDDLEMPTKTSYNPSLPIIINVLNPIDEIMVGETHTFEYEVLPYELSDAPIKFITGNPDIIAIDQSGTITPLTSGEVYVQVRSAQVSSIRTQTDFSVITTPGIEILSSHNYSDFVVGDSFTLDTILFPYTIEGQTATITSSAPEVATIDASGLVSTHGEGLVTFRASLDSDQSVYVDYTIYVHGALNPESNLLDYLTTKQINYSTIHEWTAYGYQYNYYDKRAESVSRYYFGDIPINDSKMLPVFTGIRPGEPMDPLPDGVTPYNEYNVHWIVVHDTASTALGSNALAHANYLYNNTLLENQLWVSWHFSIDDHAIYQHLPEIERGYHAGDGSTLPGQSSEYLGGGNRNGIGIEMCINEDGDMYRTWQRTAKLVTYLLLKYNLPIDHQTYHNDFSGKDCPRTLRNAGLVPLFEEFVATEYYISSNYPDAQITMTSNNPEYLDNQGRIIQIPERAMTVSYTITVTNDGHTESRTFYTYLPGTVR